MGWDRNQQGKTPEQKAWEKLGVRIPMDSSSLREFYYYYDRFGADGGTPTHSRISGANNAFMSQVFPAWFGAKWYARRLFTFQPRRKLAAYFWTGIAEKSPLNMVILGAVTLCAVLPIEKIKMSGSLLNATLAEQVNWVWMNTDDETG